MSALASVLDHLDNDTDAAIERLFELLRIPSISTDPAFAADCARTADWLVKDLETIGFKAQAHQTAGHPIILAEDHDSAGPHVLFYGHYDVQPVDPLSLWDRDPFDPAVTAREDGTRQICGRGASDDKGQVMTFIEACRAWKRAAGRLPCKVTILLEGEEESGGAHLPGFLDAHKERLSKAGIALVCDTSMWSPDTPAITTSLRGMASEEVIIHAASRDLHSGYYGGAAANPIAILARALGQLHDGEGRVTLEGFYDGVSEPSDQVKEQWQSLDFTAEEFLGEVGLKHPAGETDRSCLELVWSRPTAEINGITGGYTGVGFKTVIPAQASAKVSFRLVGEQDPKAVSKAFRAFINARIPPDCRAEFIEHGGSPAVTMPVEAPPFARARQALSDEWETDAVFVGGGGSIPVVGEFKRKLGLDALLIGFALDDDRIHSPNEKYDLRSFDKGRRSWARVLAALAEA
ncbi:M20/M25/M40 family metallo-hydrolase [Limibaculum sp. M0105]|uniref:M20/M25/M40 family metallo-hydrolase n=1 Tax=Thermohalobaculum xanthum TaxID=2753746 RepID=A0A8J7M431_9RHOB|nr:M20/M25/M40 family metallo-hydrolase [Thermohalobaculum xanthum]MBK0398006.1 M20/M25/M40 family metallo-hydrolase [Thermohalobaculum xanthum]